MMVWVFFVSNIKEIHNQATSLKKGCLLLYCNCNVVFNTGGIVFAYLI